MTSRRQQVRDWLRDQTEPKSSREIAAALGLPKPFMYTAIGDMLRQGMVEAVGAKPVRYRFARDTARIWRHDSDEERKARRKVTAARYDATRYADETPEQRRARLDKRKAKENERRRRQGLLTLDEWRAVRASEKAQRKRVEDAAKAKRKATRKERIEIARQERQRIRDEERAKIRKITAGLRTARKARERVEAKQSAQSAARRKERGIVSLHAKLSVHNALATPQVEQPVYESVEAWMKRTGNLPEVLPIGAVSNPLKHVTGHRAINEQNWRNRQGETA